MQKLKVLELFGGIGACSAALKRLNIDYEIADYVEIDKYAVKSFNAIHNTNFEPQDIKTWDKDIKVDLIMHGSPCQDFSLAGKNAGGDKGSGTRSSLMYETIRIVEKLQPKYVVWENVKNLLSKTHKHNFDAYLKTMEELGYTNYYQVLNAKDFGIPQKRERVFTISIHHNYNKTFNFPKPFELKLKLKDMLEDEVDEKYYLSSEKIAKISQWKAYQKPFEHVQGKNSISPTLTARGAGEEHSGMITISEDLEETTNLQEQCLRIKNATKQGYLEATDGDGVYITNIDKKRGTVQKEMIPTLKTSPDVGVAIKTIGNYSPSGHNASRIVDNQGIAPTVMENHGTVTATNIGLSIRKLTPKECWRLMGFNDEDYEKAAKVNSNAQLYKQAGNSIVVNVLVEIFKKLLKEGKIMEKKEEVKILTYETSVMIDLEKLLKKEPDLFNDLVKDYPVNPNTKIIIEVKG